jgi:hypothetical protein
MKNRSSVSGEQAKARNQSLCSCDTNVSRGRNLQEVEEIKSSMNLTWLGTGGTMFFLCYLFFNAAPLAAETVGNVLSGTSAN